jgi:hypothetical protein
LSRVGFATRNNDDHKRRDVVQMSDAELIRIIKAGKARVIEVGR